jgi:hypothetical protein
VTSLCVLNPDLDPASRDRGATWLLGLTGRNATWARKLFGPFVGMPPIDLETPGFPWIPGAAAWTIPTALAILALRRRAAAVRQEARDRIGWAQEFLASRVCGDGGWNYGVPGEGNTRPSYPDTTGVALLALYGSKLNVLSKAMERGEAMLAGCRSREAAAWLRMGLFSHGGRITPMNEDPGRTTTEIALQIIEAEALRGRNIFLEDA